MLIRDAALKDSGQIVAIYNPFIRNSTATFEEVEISAEEMAQRIDLIQSSGARFLVSEVEGTILGYAYASPWKTRAAYRHSVEVSVYIDPKHQGLGLGRALYERLFPILRGLDYHAVIGVITQPKAASVHLHESFGLKKVAHFSEVGRKFDQWIDVGHWQGFLGGFPKNTDEATPLA